MKKNIIIASLLAALLALTVSAADAEADITAPAPAVEGYAEVVPTSGVSNAGDIEVLFDRIAVTGLNTGESEKAEVYVSAGVPVCVSKLAFMLDGETETPVTVSVKASNDPTADGWTSLLISQSAEKVDGYFTAELLNETGYAFYCVSFTAADVDVKEIAFYTAADGAEPLFWYAPEGAVEEGSAPLLLTADEIAELKEEAAEKAAKEAEDAKRIARVRTVGGRLAGYANNLGSSAKTQKTDIGQLITDDEIVINLRTGMDIELSGVGKNDTSLESENTAFYKVPLLASNVSEGVSPYYAIMTSLITMSKTVNERDAILGEIEQTKEDITGENASANVGGICGEASESDNSLINDCYNIGEIKGEDYVGGIVGETEELNINIIIPTNN